MNSQTNLSSFPYYIQPWCIVGLEPTFLLHKGAFSPIKLNTYMFRTFLVLRLMLVRPPRVGRGITAYKTGATNRITLGAYEVCSFHYHVLISMGQTSKLPSSQERPNRHFIPTFHYYAIILLVMHPFIFLNELRCSPYHAIAVFKLAVSRRCSTTDSIRRIKGIIIP